MYQLYKTLNLILTDFCSPWWINIHDIRKRRQMAFGSQLGSFEQARIPWYLSPQVEW